jgi:hypothetical protein
VLSFPASPPLPHLSIWWMSCHTQEEIAEAENLTSQGIGQSLKEMADLPKLSKSDQAAAEHATDFDLQCLEINFSNAGLQAGKTLHAGAASFHFRQQQNNRTSFYG